MPYLQKGDQITNHESKFWKCCPLIDILQNFNFKVSKLVRLFEDMTIPSSTSDYCLLLYLCQNWALSQNKAIVIIALGLLRTHNLSHCVIYFSWKILKSLKNWESRYQMLPEIYMASLHNQMKILCRLSEWKILVSTWPLENCLSVIHPDWSKNR